MWDSILQYPRLLVSNSETHLWPEPHKGIVHPHVLYILNRIKLYHIQIGPRIEIVCLQKSTFTAKLENQLSYSSDLVTSEQQNQWCQWATAFHIYSNNKYIYSNSCFCDSSVLHIWCFICNLVSFTFKFTSFFRILSGKIVRIVELLRDIILPFTYPANFQLLLAVKTQDRC